MQWALPLSCGVFLPPPLLQAFPFLVAGQCHCSCLLQLACCEGFSLPTFVLRVPRPLCYVSFLLLLLVSFSFFTGWTSACPGGMLIWPRVVCGSTVCRLAHLVVCVFPSRLGAGIWRQHGTPPGFSFNVKWRCSVQAGGVEELSFNIVNDVRCI
jgi:hypothetical protein